MASSEEKGLKAYLEKLGDSYHLAGWHDRPDLRWKEIKNRAHHVSRRARVANGVDVDWAKRPSSL